MNIATSNSSCQLCNTLGGELITSNKLYRIVYISDTDYPGYIRLIVNEHIKEMTDLPATDCHKIFSAILLIEQVLRSELNPDKINIASFGNMTPHVHWHIIPRYINDKHFPNPIWGLVTNPDYVPPKIDVDQLKRNLRNL